MDAPTDAVDRARRDQLTAGDGTSSPFSRVRRLLRRVRERAAQESGQVLPIMMLFMVVIVGVAALAIDEAEMGAAHHRAQLAADASALSAAQDLETPGYSQTTLTSNANNIAANNDPGSTDSVSEPNPNTATSNVSAPVSLVFGGLFGLSSSHVQASATAALSTTQAAIGDSQVSSLGCNGTNTQTNCSYGPGAAIPTGDSSNSTGWAVTNYPENTGTCGGNPNNSTPAPSPAVPNDTFPCGTPFDWSGNASPPDPSTENTSSATSQVNLQDCGGGTTGAGACYPAGTTQGNANLTTATSAEPNTEVVDLNGQGEGGMWQTVNTVPGARYVLDWQMTGNPALGTYTTFYMDVQVTNGTQQYTPNVASPNTESNANLITQQVDWVSDPTWSGAVVALFQPESITFTAKSNETTITFNSQQSDNDAYDSPYGGGYFNCGPEITAIQMNYPAINLTS